jgi:hypothetical protein
MGKYTSLGNRLRDEEDHGKKAYLKYKSINSVNSVAIDSTTPPVEPTSDTDTRLRGYAVTRLILAYTK